MNKIPLVLYHANCLDGFTAAWVVWKHYKGRVECVPVSYGEDRPTCIDRDVVIVDFSYPRDVMLGMAADARNILLLDPHKTAVEDIGDPLIFARDSSWKIESELDLTRSGAMLAWNYYHPTQQDSLAPFLVQHVQDRDLWKFSLVQTKEVMAAVASYEQSFEMWGLLEDHCQRGILAAEGVALLRQHSKTVNAIVESTTRKITIDGCLGLSSNCNYQFASDVGHKLAAISGTYGATWFTKPDGSVQFSLRSVGDYDVSAMGKLFGGGGHKNAAGFTLSMPTETDGITVWSSTLGNSLVDEEEDAHG